MEYSAIHNKLIIEENDLKQFSIQIRYMMASIRKALKVPLTPRKRDSLEKIDYIEKDIINACKSIGVNLGSEWGNNIDLSEFNS